MTTNDDAFEIARSILPGGVDSPVRAFGSVGGIPRSYISGRGPYLTDIEGREYVDLVGQWGPAILGHAHPAVIDAVRDAAGHGLGFGASHPGEAQLALAIRDRVSPDLIERVRLVSTGTEATMTAIRLARGATGRDLIVKFAGHYHGHSDGLLAEAGSGVATLALPGSAGVPAAIAAQTIVLPYHDLDAVHELFAVRGDQVAAIIVEAAPANIGVVTPDVGFNASLSRIAHEYGALLIVDEVLTGFRSSASGWWGLENDTAPDDTAKYLPDLVTYGKIVGGGLPLAALAGRADVMDLLAPAGPVYQAGTLSGNPIAVAAGRATLAQLDADSYTHLERVAHEIADAASAALSAEGVAHSIQFAGSLFSIAFSDAPPRDYAQMKAQEAYRYPPFFHAMLEAGVSLPPSVYEAWFVSTAHDDAAVGAHHRGVSQRGSRGGASRCAQRLARLRKPRCLAWLARPRKPRCLARLARPRKPRCLARLARPRKPELHSPIGMHSSGLRGYSGDVFKAPRSVGNANQDQRTEHTVKGKILLVVGLGVGYILGTKAGRERYNQIVDAASKLWNDPRVQKRVDQAEDFVKDKAPDVAEFLADGAKTVVSKVSGSTPTASKPAASKSSTSKPTTSK